MSTKRLLTILFCTALVLLFVNSALKKKDPLDKKKYDIMVVSTRHILGIMGYFYSRKY